MSKNISDEERGKLAADVARSKILKQCQEVKLTTKRTLKRISEGLDAIENKVFYDKDRGKCIVGPDMINWAARQKSVDQSITILDLKPPEKKEITGSLTMNHELPPDVEAMYAKIYLKGKHDKKRGSSKL